MFVVIGLSWVIASTVHGAEPPPSQNAALESFFREYLDEAFRLEPLMATRQGDHRFDDQIDDLSKEARQVVVEHDRKTLADLSRKFQSQDLSRDHQIDLEIFRRHLERSIWQAETFHPFEDDPRVYVSYVTESVYLLLTQSSLARDVNLKNSLSRMAKIPMVLEIARTRIKSPPRVKVQTAIKQTEGAIGFYADELFKLVGEKPDHTELSLKAERIVASLNRYLDFLKTEVLPRSNESWRIGPELFARKLDLELDAGLSASEVLDEAEREAARVESEMALIARQMWGTAFPFRPLPLDDPQAKRAMIQQVLDVVASDHGKAETLVADVRGTVGEIKTFITAHKILRLIEPDQCRIVEMPEFLRGNSVAYLNPAPPLDIKGSSEYAISPPPRDWSPQRAESYLARVQSRDAQNSHNPRRLSRPLCTTRVQQSLSFIHPPRPFVGDLRRGMGGLHRADDARSRLRRGNLGLRLQQMKFYLRAVVNAILDHKMHAGKMTDAEAMDLLVGRAFQTEGEAVGKIVRAKQTSCQLSTYFVGRTAFYRLRQQVQRELGERFDLAKFHEAALAHGTIPVKYLPELVRKSLDLPPLVK